MPEIVADPPSPAVIACFPGLNSGNFNDLVLIRLCFARARRWADAMIGERMADMARQRLQLAA